MTIEIDKIEHRCPYCGTPMQHFNSKAKNFATKDHVVAKCKGGRDTILVCYDCNHKKGAQSLLSFLTKKYPSSPSKVFNVISRCLPYISSPRDRVLYIKENITGIAIPTPQAKGRPDFSVRPCLSGRTRQDDYLYPVCKPKQVIS